MKLRVGFAVPWRTVGVTGMLAVAAIGVLSYRLQSLVPGLANAERAQYVQYAALPGLLSDPLNLPMKLLLAGEHALPRHDTAALAHAPSILLALIAITAFTYVLRRWYGRRSMLFGFAMLLCSAWFLHLARFASFDIETLAAIGALLAAHIYLNDHEENLLAWLGWLVTNLLVLFIPGMVWFVLVGATLQWRAVWHAWQTLGIASRVASVLLFLLGAGWLAYSFVRHVAYAHVWLGMPHPTISTLRAAPNALLQTIMAVGFQGPHRPELWLGQLPVLDIFTLSMLLAGLIFYGRHWRAPRTVLLGLFIVMALALSSVGGAGLDVIAPVLYLIAVGGIAYVLHFWLKVFPRNPIARFTGLAVVAALVGLSCYYNLVQYFVAWPHNPETIAVYHQK